MSIIDTVKGAVVTAALPEVKQSVSNLFQAISAFLQPK